MKIAIHIHDMGACVNLGTHACAEMRKCVPEGKRAEYALTLGEICGKSGDMGWGEADAKPEQHCETFLRVMGKWVGE